MAHLLVRRLVTVGLIGSLASLGSAACATTPASNDSQGAAAGAPTGGARKLVRTDIVQPTVSDSGASDAGPPSPSIGSFAVYATEAIELNSGAEVAGCNVGVENTTGPFLGGGAAANLNSGAHIPSPDTLYAYSVFLNSGASVGPVDTYDLMGNSGATHGAISPFPTMPSPPPLPPVIAGTAAVTLNVGSSKTLSAGAYGNVTVNSGATLSLTGGGYVFSSLALNSGASLVVGTPTTLSITGSVSFNSGSSTGPASGSGLTAKSLAMYFDTSSAISFNSGARVQALVVATNALVTVNTSKFTGALAAAQVVMNSGASVTCQDGFATLPCTGSCDDGNPCTVDGCYAGSCTHTPVANATACNDGNACDLNDTCQGAMCTPGSTVTCAALDQCHVPGICNPTTGQCSNPAATNGTTCNDGNACDLNDTCQTGLCTAGGSVACAALDQCHVAGTCNPQTGQCSNPTAPQGTTCNEGNACDLNDRCQAGVCLAGTSLTDCNGACVNTLTDSLNCGACGSGCDGTCANGSCTVGAFTWDGVPVFGGAGGGNGQNGWSSLGSGFISDPAIVRVTSTHFLAAATGGDGNLYTNWYDLFARSWGGWASLGNAGNPLVEAPVMVVIGSPPEIELFVIDTVAGQLVRQQGTIDVITGAPPAWLPFWTPLPGPPGSLTLANTGRPPTVVVSQPNTQVNIFATLSDGSIGVAYANSAQFFNWTLLGGESAYEPGAASWGPNRLDVFTSTLHQLNHLYSNDNGVTWQGSGGGAAWEVLGGSVWTTPQVVSWGANRLDVLATGIYGEYDTLVQHLSWNGSTWGNTWCGTPPCWDMISDLTWSDDQHGFATPIPITTGPGSLEVFVQQYDHSLANIPLIAVETATSPPTWGPPEQLMNCSRTGGSVSVISPNGYDYVVAMTGWDPSGDTAVWVNSTSDYFIPSTTSPEACPSCGGYGQPCCWAPPGTSSTITGFPSVTCTQSASCGGDFGAPFGTPVQMCACVTGSITGPEATCSLNALFVGAVSDDVPTAFPFAYALYDGPASQGPQNVLTGAASPLPFGMPAPPGAGYEVYFSPGTFPPNQTVVVYDVPYGSPPGPNDEGGSSTQADVVVGSWPCQSTHFVSLSGGAGNQPLVAYNVNAQHVIRYVEGTCRIKIPLADIFLNTENTIMEHIASSVNAKAPSDTYLSDDYQIIQPQFTSQGVIFQQGFLFEGDYDFKWAGLAVANATVDPIFSLTGGPPSPAPDGLASVSLLAQNIYLQVPGDYNDIYGTIQTTLQSQLTSIGQSIESGFNEPVSVIAAQPPFNVTIPPGDTSCVTPTPGAPSEECFSSIETALKAAGLNSIASALQVQNFSCLPNVDPTTGNQCNFHPVLQALNILPTALEVVVAPDLTNTAQDILTPFYSSMSGLSIPLPAYGFTATLDCSTLPAEVTTGSVTTYLSDDTTLDGAPYALCGLIATDIQTLDGCGVFCGLP